MKKLTLILLATIPAVYVYAGPSDKYISVAVIDTGIDTSIKAQGYSAGICKMGHKDFTGLGLKDNHGHGTNISGLIHKYAGKTKYCQVILKFYDPKANWKSNMKRMLEAIRYAVNIKVNYINISGGGPGFSAEEQKEILRALNSGITIVTAAGNESCRLSKDKCDYYPAMYDKRIVVVGNGITESSRDPSSNWGDEVDIWIDGQMKKGDYGRPMTGTSQSTAIQTGKLVRQHVQSR